MAESSNYPPPHNSVGIDLVAFLDVLVIIGRKKVNNSGPRRIGEFEFNNPRAAAVFMDLPRRIADLEQKVEKVLTLCERMEPDSKPELPKSMQLFQIRNKLGTLD